MSSPSGSGIVNVSSRTVLAPRSIGVPSSAPIGTPVRVRHPDEGQGRHAGQMQRGQGVAGSARNVDRLRPENELLGEIRRHEGHRAASSPSVSAQGRLVGREPGLGAREGRVHLGLERGAVLEPLEDRLQDRLVGSGRAVDGVVVAQRAEEPREFAAVGHRDHRNPAREGRDAGVHPRAHEKIHARDVGFRLGRAFEARGERPRRGIPPPRPRSRGNRPRSAGSRRSRGPPDGSRRPPSPRSAGGSRGSAPDSRW